MANIEERIEQLLGHKISELEYELYDVEYAKEGKEHFLRIYIDSPHGIGLEDCEKVSNNITDILDEEDIIKEQYFLEVSSPGIERVLRKEKHLKDNIGNLISLKLFKPLENQKQFTGELIEFDSDMIKINLKGKTVEVGRKNVAQVKTVYNWEE